MSQPTFLLLLSLHFAACATQPLGAERDPSDGGPTTASSETPVSGASSTSPSEGDAVRRARPSVSPGGTARIGAGPTPESGPHSWGSRSFEITRAAQGPWRVRVRDEMFFQGAGMRPEDRPAPTQRCTDWSDVPGDVATQANLDGLDFTKDTVLDAGATEGVLRGWLERSAPPVTDVLGNLAFGRRFGPC